MAYEDHSYDEMKNTLHKTHIINERNGANLGKILSEKSFSLQEFIMKRDGSFQSNSTTLKFNINREPGGFIYKEDIDLKDTVLQIPTLDNRDPEESIFEDWDFESAIWVQTEILLEDLLKEGDKLIFIDEIEGEFYEFFTGYVSKPPSKVSKNSFIEITAEVKDRTFKLLEKAASEDIFRQGWYICNNSSKETSLLHFLAGELGYTEDQMDFEDITYQGEHVYTSVVKIDKGSKLLSEFAEACRATEARFHQVKDKLVVRSYLQENISTYVFDERNVLRGLEELPNVSQHSQVEVTYERLIEKDEQLVWALVGEGGTVDKANIKIAPGTTEENNKKSWIIDFRPSGVVTEYQAPEIEAALADGTAVSLEYRMELDKNGGKLKLLNSLSEDVFLNKFHIKGKPVFYFPGNTITYPGDDSKNLLKPTLNKYIQNVNMAAIKAKNTFNFECLAYDRVSFDSNVSRWLMPGMVCQITHKDYKQPTKEVIIESITRAATSCRITARTYLGAVEAGDLEENNKSGVTDEEMAGTNLDNVVTVDPERPPAPVIRSTEPNVGGIVVTLEEYIRKDIANFEFRLTMVNPDNTPHTSGIELTFYYNTLHIPIMLTKKEYYNMRWQVEVRAWDLKSRISDWSEITADCYAVSQRMPSEGIEDHSISTNKLVFDNNDAIYVDENGFLRIKVDGVLIGPDENLHEKLTEVDNNISNAESNANSYADNKLNDFISSVYDPKIANLENQIDGNITTWFYDYEPTISNPPASDWVSTEDKNTHLGDLFYNTSSGYSYRFTLNNEVYSWSLIKDTDITLAIQKAAEAQDTADNKRRVFVTTPTPPYDVGDLWSEGSSGDIMKCIVTRISGEYQAGDWEKASKYTDDTTANEAKGVADGANTKAEEILTKLENGEIILNSNTSVYGMLKVMGGGKGIESYNGTTEDNSTKKVTVDGGELSYLEKNGENWITKKIFKNSAIGSGKNNDIVDLRQFSNGIPWKEHEFIVAATSVNLPNNSSAWETYPVPLGDDKYKLKGFADSEGAMNLINTQERTSDGTLSYGSRQTIKFRVSGKFTGVSTYKDTSSTSAPSPPSDVTKPYAQIKFGSTIKKTVYGSSKYVHTGYQYLYTNGSVPVYRHYFSTEDVTFDYTFEVNATATISVYYKKNGSTKLRATAYYSATVGAEVDANVIWIAQEI